MARMVISGTIEWDDKIASQRGGGRPMSDYRDLCQIIKDERRRTRKKYGVPCPECVRLLPKAQPTILLPGQRCKIHGYRDSRKRTKEMSYMWEVNR